MTERIQKTKQTQERATEEVAEDLPGKNEDAERLKAESDRINETIDDLLDEVDDMIADIEKEQSAEDFVSGFQQKGGQ